MLESGAIRRLAVFRARGVTAATLDRMVGAGEAMRLSRGLYQKPDANNTAQHTLAEPAKRVPKGVVCLVSALVFHQISLQLPRDSRMVVGINDQLPKGGSQVSAHCDLRITISVKASRWSRLKACPSRYSVSQKLSRTAFDIAKRLACLSPSKTSKKRCDNERRRRSRLGQLPCLVASGLSCGLISKRWPLLAKGLMSIGASVRARLLAYSKEHGQGFELVLTRYAIGRLLYRLSMSSGADWVVLKGATLVMIWFDEPYAARKTLTFWAMAIFRPNNASHCLRPFLPSLKAMESASMLKALRFGQSARTMTMAACSYLSSATIFSAAADDEAGFWPVTSWPSCTTKLDQSAPFS